MIKLIITGRCTREKSREAAHRHMRLVHGPMVYAAPPDVGPMPRDYAQNPVFDDRGALPASWRATRDFVTEVGFNDFAHLAASVATPYYLNQLRPDEANFVDPPSVRAFPTRRESASGVEGGEAVRLFMFLKRRGEEKSFAHASRQALDALANDAAVTARASDVALASSADPQAPYDRVERLSFADRAAALNFARRRFQAFAERLRPHFEPGESFALFADHYSVGRLRACHGEGR